VPTNPEVSLTLATPYPGEADIAVTSHAVDRLSFLQLARIVAKSKPTVNLQKSRRRVLSFLHRLTD